MDLNDTLIVPEGRARLEGRPTSVGSSVLGRYHLLERLGAGGFGVVWRAHDGLLEREVAVKAIPLPAGEDYERATREALAAARLAHPAIVALYEACVEDDTFYLISELVPGETLAALLAKEALCDEEILEIGVALADALLHAHSRGVIHRDLKPHNVLVSQVPSGRPRPHDTEGSSRCSPDPPSPAPLAKLTDFGGALLAGEEALTRTGDVLGTLAYMAPEQIEGAEVDEQADLYSLALVLYEALCGVNPVRGPTPAATARRIGCELPPLERRRRDLPRGLTRALDGALDPDPRERGSLSELRAAISHALDRGMRGSPRRRHASPPPMAPGRPAPAGPEGPGPSQSRLHPLGTLLATVEAPPLERPGARASEHPGEDPDASGWLTLPRLGWLAATLAVCVWLLTAGRPGLALVALCAVVPLVLLVRRPGLRWLAAALAPVLGLAGLAGAMPALAGQPARWRERALLGALGYWWLRLAELPLAPPPQRLWLGPPPALGRWASWEGSLSTTAAHAIFPLLSLALLLGAALWALAAALLPWIVRGRSALLDALAAILWAVALAAATPALDRGLPFAHAAATGLGGASVPSPRGVILGAALGAVLAVAARALRGPV
ncbi:MAG: protein kinase domain-containing protein [Solirubrobacteraceae bacterium]